VAKILSKKNKAKSLILRSLCFGASLLALTAGQSHAQTATYYGVGAAQYNFDYSKAQINAGTAYQMGVLGVGETVAVLDSGVDTQNIELQRGTMQGYDAINNSFGVNTDPTGHGTFVTGIINSAGYGIEGTAFGAQVYPVRVINSSGTLAVNDIQLALANVIPFIFGARIINNSWDSSTPITQTSAASMQAYYPISMNFYSMLVKMGVAFVFAAGNQGSSQVGSFAGLPYLFPQLQPGWLAVVATNSTGQLASFSNQCGVAAAWCLAAPGANIVSTLGTGYGIGSGTSFATPEVSAALALVMEHFPYLTAGQAAQILLATATKTGIYANEQVYGQGLLNVAAALQPVGPVTIPAANTIGGVKVTAASSAVIGSASFAQSWEASVGPIMVLDNYNRGYTVNASAFQASPTHTLDTRTATLQYGMGEMNKLSDGVSGFWSNAYMEAPMGRVALTSGNGAVVEGSTGTDPAYGFGPYASGTMPAGALIVNDGVGNPFLGLADQATAAHVAAPLNFGGIKMSASVFDGYAKTADLTARMTDPSYVAPTVAGGTVEFSAPVEAMSGSVAVNFGGVRENGRILGGSSGGAFGQTDSTTSYFAGLDMETELAEGVHLIGGMEFGQSTAKQSASALNVQYGTISSQSFHMGVVTDGVITKNDKVGFVVSQPLRVSGGNVSVDVPEERDFSGNIITDHETVGAADNGHEMDFQTFYALHSTKSTSFDAGVLVRFQPDNVRTAAPEAIGIMRLTQKF
jgi:hypothetical protein